MSVAPVIERGDRVPLFSVTTIDGRDVRYADVWQRQNLLLVTTPGATAGGPLGAYARNLEARVWSAPHLETACVVTSDAVEGVPVPAVLIADRWGEVVAVTAASGVGDLPPADDVIAWLEHLQHRCPECEGESR